MERLKELSFQEKEQLCMYLGKLYRKGTLQTMMGCSGIVEDSCDCQEDAFDIAARIRLLICHMEKNYALILYNDFLEIKERGWWSEWFSRSSYYRYKKSAMDTFLSAFYTNKGESERYGKKSIGN